MTYQESLHYLNSLINYEKRDSYNYNQSFRLERMVFIVRTLGDPQKGIPSIHIAGSKGKGSTSAIIHSILKEAGFRVGLYTSPHLASFRERIRINDDLISEADIGRLLEKVRAVTDQMADDPPSFFEAYTALAFLCFKERSVDFAVYETGLGGRLDATNVITPLVEAITPISYEHTRLLGNTLAEIAGEKCGIIKSGSLCVSAPQDEEALTVIEDVCRRQGVKLILIGRDIMFEELEASDAKEVFSVDGIFKRYPRLETKLLGRHQVINSAVAIGVVEGLRSCGVKVSSDAVKKGIENVRWDGRLEVARRSPYVVLDGAQNKASAQALASAVKKVFRYKRLILVLGVSKDKDIAGILAELVPMADAVILTRAGIAERAAAPSAIKDLIAGDHANVMLTGSVEEAVRKALASAGTEDMVLITGSLFVEGEARPMVTDTVAYA